MTKQFYNVGDTFVDKESGETLRCVEGDCRACFYRLKLCVDIPECRAIFRETNDSVCFELVGLPDNTPITAEILSNNGWSNPLNNIMAFISDDVIFGIKVNEGFACWLKYNGDTIGREFTTIGELKAIAKALYKIELKFE